MLTKTHYRLKDGKRMLCGRRRAQYVLYVDSHMGWATWHCKLCVKKLNEVTRD